MEHYYDFGDHYDVVEPRWCMRNLFVYPKKRLYGPERVYNENKDEL